MQQPRYYIGVKQVLAWPQDREGRPGYAVRYADGYESWSPKDAFEKANLPMEFGTDGSRVSSEMVRAFIKTVKDQRVGKTTVLHATLVNGFEIVESASAVDEANYDHAVGVNTAMNRVRDRVWQLLGFLLQCARSGVTP